VFFENVEHLALVVGIAATTVGLLKAIKAWKKARDAEVAARIRHEESIRKVLKHFETNGGNSVLDKINRIDTSLADHIAKAEQSWKVNVDEHREINERIDGMFGSFIRKEKWER
jgi:hypothetical protein